MSDKINLDRGQPSVEQALDAMLAATRSPQDSWICWGNHRGDLDGSADAEKVEAILMLARMTTDAEGLALAYRLPPAIAVAIVNAFGSGDPVLYVKSRMRVTGGLERPHEHAS